MPDDLVDNEVLGLWRKLNFFQTTVAETMAKHDDKKTERKSGKFAHLRIRKMSLIEHLLKKGKYVEGSDLAAALHEQVDEPVPPQVLDYLCRYLEGEVARPRGRKATPAFKARRKNMILRLYYQHLLTWLQKRRKHYGNLDGWPSIREATWWQGPPNERAARMVANRFFYGAGSWRTVKNYISSRD